MPIQIAVIFEFPSLNGGENSMLQTMDAMNHDEFQFTAIAPPTGDLADALHSRSITHVPIDFHDSNGVRLSRPSLCDTLTALMDQLPADLLHANSLSMGRLTGAIQHRLSIPCTTHLRDIMKLSRATVRDINSNHLIVSVSNATRDFHVQQGIDSSRSCVVTNTVDCERFTPRPATGWLRGELKLPCDSFTILTIGQIGLRKAQNVLAAAAPLIAAAVPNVHFVVVGQRNSLKRESVEFERQMQASFQAAGLGDRFHQIGYRNDVDRMLNEADLLVHAAKQEPLGRVLLEAAAAGLAIVATDVGGTSEILTDGLSARLVPPADVAALASAVIELAGQPSRRRKFADAARSRMLVDFDASKSASRLGVLWQQILKAAR